MEIIDKTLILYSTDIIKTKFPMFTSDSLGLHNFNIDHKLIQLMHNIIYINEEDCIKLLKSRTGEFLTF